MIFLRVLPKILKSAGHQTTARPARGKPRPGPARPAGRVGPGSSLPWFQKWVQFFMSEFRPGYCTD